MALERTDATAGLKAFEGQKYLSIETYRRNGAGVRTPVWFAVGSDTRVPALYIYSTADAGKAKRIRCNGVVKIAPCDYKGTITGPWLHAAAEIVSDDAFEAGMRLLNQKYWPWKQLLNLSARLFGRQARVVIVIRPA